MRGRHSKRRSLGRWDRDRQGETLSGAFVAAYFCSWILTHCPFQRKRAFGSFGRVCAPDMWNLHDPIAAVRPTAASKASAKGVRG